MENIIEPTSKISPEEAFHINSILARITDDHWEKFVSVKLKLDAGKVKQMASKYRFHIIREWREKIDLKGKDVCTHIEILIQEYLCEESTPAVPLRSPPDSDVCANDRYPRTHGKGCALIIVNSFNWDQKPLLTAKEDKRLMKDLWHKTLGCDLLEEKVHIDQTAGQMKRLLKKMTSLEEKYDYVVVVISTHGGVFPENVVLEHEVKEDVEEVVLEHKAKGDIEPIKGKPSQGDGEDGNGRNAQFEKNKEAFKSSVKAAKDKSFTVEVFLGDDYKPVREREIKKYFYNDRSTALHDIPKFFILDYCRGNEVFDGVVPKATEEVQVPNDVTCLMPAVSDVLVAYATHPSYVALGAARGSWLISAIAGVFKDNYQKRDVVKMLTMVNERMKRTVGYELSKILQRLETRTAMSVFESSLTKDFYLK